MKFLPFHKARNFVHTLGLKSVKDWRAYCKSGKKPKEIPATPERSYWGVWIDWGDWLGAVNLRKLKAYLPFEDAKKIVHKLGLRTEKQWREYSKSGEKPRNIPSTPNIVYLMVFG